MTAKAEKSKTPEPEYFYDARIPQTIPFTLTSNGRDYPVTHTTNPLTDARYFQLQTEIEAMARKSKKLSTAIYGPKVDLYHELIESQEGYKKRPDWKERTHESDAIATINALIHADVVDESDMPENDRADDLFDIDALTPVMLRAQQGGVLMELTLYFRPETQAETDHGDRRRSTGT